MIEKRKLKIGWVGFHKEGLRAFLTILKTGYDIKMIIRTLVVIIMKTLGKRHFNYPPEYYMAISKHKKEPLPY